MMMSHDLPALGLGVPSLHPLPLGQPLTIYTTTYAEADMETLPAVRNVSVMPVMTLLEAAERRNAIVEFTKALMVPGVDYGVIPGAGDKPVLFKPGAEKLVTLFGLSASFVTDKEVMDWTGRDHDGEPFFYMKYRCQLSRGGDVMGEGIGSCNSWEKKYRYRRADPLCPECSAPAVRKGREEYGGGWYCNRRAGGCGAKWANPPFDTSQLGQIKNPDIADQVNTIDKMAQKRALVAATLITINASEFFTQDLEDARIDMPIVEGLGTEEPLAPPQKVAEVQFNENGQPFVARLDGSPEDFPDAPHPGSPTRAEAIEENLDLLQIREARSTAPIAMMLLALGVIPGDETELIDRTLGTANLDYARVLGGLAGWKRLPALWMNKYTAILRERAGVSKEHCLAYMEKHFKDPQGNSISNPAKLNKAQQEQLINWLSVSEGEPYNTGYYELVGDMCLKLNYSEAVISDWLASFGISEASSSEDIDKAISRIHGMKDIEVVSDIEARLVSKSTEEPLGLVLDQSSSA